MVGELPKPTAYTPFLRRLFGDERSRELREVEELYRHVRRRQDEFKETNLSVGAHIFDAYSFLPEEVRRPFTFALYDFLEAERLWELPQPDFRRMSMKEFVAYRNLLQAKEYFFTNQDVLLELLKEGLTLALGGIAEQLPEMEDPTPFTIPLIYALPEPRLHIEQVCGTLIDERYADRGLFKELNEQFYRNMCRVSARHPDDEQSRKPFKYPRDSDLPLDELVDTYLAGTPLHQVFMAPVPLKLTRHDRFNHMHVLAGSGHGKTTLIENLIRHDLESENPPSIVLIDPHSDLVRKLMRSQVGACERIILIDPRDTQFPVALNPLAINHERLDSYDETTREQVTAGVIQTFGYLWNGLTNLTLTGKQEVFFRYVTRLLLTFPHTMGRNATILDMLNVMKDLKPYEEAIKGLPPIAREFFETDFKAKTFDGTREQIRYRIQAIIENPTMARLFTSRETKVDFFTELNRGGIILIDTAKDFLKPEASAVFGKLMISLIFQAVLERAAIPEEDRKPTFLFVDEAGTFFSSNIDDLLTESRKYKAGLILSHQYLDQATGSLRASLAANTGIKFAGGLSAADASAMAREMRTTPDFILSQPKLQFAAHIRDVTPSAVSIPIKRVGAERLSDEAYHLAMERNRKRVSMSVRPEPQAPQSRPADEPDEDISREW